MFKKILFATTASPTCDNAAKVAFDLELKWDAELIVFHVLGIPSRGYSPFVTDVRTGEIMEPDPDYVEWVKEEMKNTYDKLLADSENSRIEAAVGVPYREILRKARKENVDLIIMGAHTRQEDVGATRYRDIVGSTMQKVAKSARCPVVIINRPCTTCWKLFSNIVFGTDFSKAADYAYQWAYNLAKEVGAKLHLFHACDINTSAAGVIMGQAEIENKIQEAKAKMEARYISKMNGYDNYDIEVREGIPYIEILKLAREKTGDLIVMAHHTREIDPEKAALGSTVEQVVLRSACPVASVNHPDKVVDL
ncbi:MAG: universal stress protein [Desulfobacteraceae bacterium]|jgi:nucleotide-binding universal stress UspA family protein|nr:universal stress protein [Desulfobacteraceae bacterium]